MRVVTDDSVDNGSYSGFDFSFIYKTLIEGLLRYTKLQTHRDELGTVPAF